MLVGLVVVLFTTGGIGASVSGPASALGLDAFCVETETWVQQPVEDYPGGSMAAGGVAFLGSQGLGTATNIVNDIADPSGIAGSVNSIYPPYDKSTGKNAITAYEWWGLAGQTWQVNNIDSLVPLADCGPTALGWQAGMMLANFLWQSVVLVGQLVIFIYALASSPNFINIFMVPLDSVLGQAINSLYLPFLAPMVMLAALWIAWVGLVKKRSSESVQGVVWVVCAAGLFLVFLSNPVFFAKGMNDLIGKLQTTIIQTISDPVAGRAASETLCYAGDAQTAANFAYDPANSSNNVKGTVNPNLIKGTLNNGNQFDAGGLSADQQAAVNYASVGSRNFQCAIWQIFIFEPWQNGQFGSMSAYHVDGVENDKSVKINGRSLGDSGFGAGQKWGYGTTWAIQYLNARVANHNVVMSRQHGGMTAPGMPADAEAQWGGQANRDALQAQVTWLETTYAEPYKNGGTNAAGEVVSKQAGVMSFIGSNSSQQMSMALLALVAILFGGIPILVLSVKMLFYEFMTVMMLLLAPIYLTIGIHPGFGRRVSMGWLEYIINLGIKRLAIVALLSAMMVIIQVIVMS